MNFPKVSVIVPNYNHGIYLEQRLETVLSQTYENFELIILDDSSTDNSREIISRYANNPHVRHVILNEQNSGSPFLQWRRGAELATGEWIWIAESDDFAEENFLEIMISALNYHSNVSLIYCDSYIVDNEGVRPDTFADKKNREFGTHKWSKNHINNGINEVEHYLLKHSTINNTSAVLFKRTIWLSVNSFDLNLRYIGDKYAFIKVLSRGDVMYVKDTLNYYRDPFNSKHLDKLIYIFYEEFLVFNWVCKNLKLSDKRIFMNAFYEKTQFSVYTNWSNEKISILKKLFFVNARLAMKCLLYNLQRPFFN